MMIEAIESWTNPRKKLPYVLKSINGFFYPFAFSTRLLISEGEHEI